MEAPTATIEKDLGFQASGKLEFLRSCTSWERRVNVSQSASLQFDQSETGVIVEECPGITKESAWHVPVRREQRLQFSIWIEHKSSKLPIYAPSSHSGSWRTRESNIR